MRVARVFYHPSPGLKQTDGTRLHAALYAHPRGILDVEVVEEEATVMNENTTFPKSQLGGSWLVPLATFLSFD